MPDKENAAGQEVKISITMPVAAWVETTEEAIGKAVAATLKKRYEVTDSDAERVANAVAQQLAETTITKERTISLDD